MATTTYLAMSIGLVAKPIGIAMPWATPPIIGGYLATGSINGSILQVVNLAIAMVIYMPFFKIWDHMKLKEETASKKSNKAE